MLQFIRAGNWLAKKSLICLLILPLVSTQGLCSTKANSKSFTFSDNKSSADLSYEISWTDSETKGDSVSFYYSDDKHNNLKSLIVMAVPVSDTRNYFIWNTAHIPAGHYQLSCEYTSGNNVSEITFKKTINISHDRNCLDIDSNRNLLMNPGFEEGKNSPKGWDIIVPNNNRGRSWKFLWARNAELSHSGTRSIQIANIFNGTHSDNGRKDRVIVESNKNRLSSTSGKFLLTAWIKTIGVEAGHVNFSVNYYNQLGFPLKKWWNASDLFDDEGGADSTWRQVAFVVTPPHKKTDTGSEELLPHKFSLSVSLDRSPGSLLVDDISFVPISDEEYRSLNPVYRYAPPQINTAISEKYNSGQTNKEFELRNVSGVWWLVAPDHTFLWSRGATPSTNHLLLASTGLKQKEYLKQVEFQAARDLGFNQRWRKKDKSGLYGSLQNDIAWLNFSSEADITVAPDIWVAKNKNNELIARAGHYFPDVFSPVWQKYATDIANTLQEDDGWIIENKQTIGYWTDNEWAYGDLFDFIWGDASKLAFVDWLQGKDDLPTLQQFFENHGYSGELHVPKGFELPHPYSNIQDLNKAWSSGYHTYQYHTFHDIGQSDRPYIRGHDDPVRVELFAFERVIYKIYVDTVVDNIRRAEREFSAKTGISRNHLIFSNRFLVETASALSALERNMDIFSRFDVIAVNLYPYFNQLSSFYPYWLLKKVKETFYDTTGRPLYISEFGLAAEQANSCKQTPCMTVARWRPNTVKYQFERGWAYHNIMATFANLPFIVGANWFKWANGYGVPPGSDIRNSGLVDDTNHYYADFTDMVRSTNRQISTINRSENFVLEDIDWSSTRIHLCEPASR